MPVELRKKKNKRKKQKEDRQMGKKEMLEELDDLLSIPQIDRIIFHKIEELKSYFEDEVSLYMNLKEGFRKAAYGNMQIYEGVESKKNQTYQFRLDKDENDEWNITDIEPSPRRGIEPNDIVPRVLIDFMTSFKSNPAKIEVLQNFTHPDVKGRGFHLRFAKYSDRHLLGTITEYRIETEETSAEVSKAAKIVEINDYYKNESPEFNYRELKYYMENFPEFKDHILSEFFLRWKPLIDQNILRLM
jgi:hypothetical protein